MGYHAITNSFYQIAFQESDMMSAPLIIQNDRKEVMDFTFPFYMEESALLYKDSASPLMESLLLIRPYRLEVWVIWAILIPSVGMILWGFGCSVRYIYEKKAEFVLISPISTSIWTSFGSAFNQGETS